MMESVSDRLEWRWCPRQEDGKLSCETLDESAMQGRCFNDGVATVSTTGGR
jgi:hypothetical protein